MVDEPTANLDRDSADSVVQLLADLRSAGKALLVASHDPTVIERADNRLQLEMPWNRRRSRSCALAELTPLEHVDLVLGILAEPSVLALML